MKSIVFAAQKGGSGKSTSAVCTAYALAADGGKVCFVDLDAQCNATLILTGSQQGTRGKTVKDVLQGSRAGDALQPWENGFILAGDPFLSDLDIKNLAAVKTILDAIQGRFDYVVIDLPPALGAVVLSAMAAANYVVVPSRVDLLGVQATQNTLNTIKTVQKRSNRGLKAGVLPVMHNSRATLNKTCLDALQTIGKAYGARTFAPIRQGIAIAEAQALHRNLFTYAPRAGVTMDYRQFYNDLKGEIENG